MRLWKRLWRLLCAGRSKKQTVAIEQFAVEPISQELNLRCEARRLAEAGSSAMLGSGVEAAIVARVDKGRHVHIENAGRRAIYLGEQLALHDVAMLVEDALQSETTFAAKADVLLDQARPALNLLSDRASRAETDLQSFREMHGITWSAKYPKGGQKVLHIVLVLVLVTIEAVLNSSFFATGLDTGLIGGFLQAAVLALLNVGVAFVFGLALIRNVSHRKTARKLLGIASLVAALLSMLGVSFAIAHFRGALVADLPSPEKVALATLLQTPFGLDDIQSWVLVCVSLFFAGFALVEGFRMDDRYPGYGKRDRDFLAAKIAYETRLSAMRRKIEEIKCGVTDALDKAVSEAKAHVRYQDANIEQRKMAQHQLDFALTEATQCKEALLRIFQAELRMHWKGHAALPDFPPLPEFKDIPLPDFRIAECHATCATQHARVDGLIEAQPSIKAAIRTAFVRKSDGLRPIDEQYRGSVAAACAPVAEAAA
ncbi:hypothetical protein AWB67_06403 [Caballeronia terrestris]|uniref:Transmembrane protein n=1 Tax=Caballeronia terrestris TaxID=1226301 RepID=A0A158KQR8_9BURK|nr:hypothetical protein AWB67_06403 [Caballeronia terrestris]